MHRQRRRLQSLGEDRRVRTTSRSQLDGLNSRLERLDVSSSGSGGQLFTDRFIEQRITNRTHPEAGNGPEKAFSILRSPTTANHFRVGLSQFRRQSLPSRVCRPKESQQSVPSKFSPKQPLLAKRHSVQSKPVVPLQHRAHHRSRSVGPSSRITQRSNLHPLQEATGSIPGSLPAPLEGAMKKKGLSTAQQKGSLCPIRTSVSERTKKRHHSLIERSSSHERRGIRTSIHLPTSVSDPPWGSCGAGYHGDDSFVEDTFILEDPYHNDEDDGFCEVQSEEGDDVMFFEEELTDFEDECSEDTSSERGSIRDPFTCIQRPDTKSYNQDPENDRQIWRLKLLMPHPNEQCNQEDDTCEHLPETATGSVASSHAAAERSPFLSPLPPVRGDVRTQGRPTESSLCTISDDLHEQPSPPLTPSLFPGVPPAIHFPLQHEKYEPLPRCQQALLKWKICSITPNIVRSCISRVGFSMCTRGTQWLGYWGKHMTAECFKEIREYQKVNHFPGTFQIGRKDRLWRNLSRMQARVGKKECDFVPKTFVLPDDLNLLKVEWDDSRAKQKWILKPPAAARGIGIKVVHKWTQIPKKKPVIVQKYLANPFLINGNKFDLRVYVFVSSYDPLRIYIFRNGLARFATCKYSSSKKSLSNRFMHLTNYSINKNNSDFIPNSDETVCQGHKWGLLALWQYMQRELGINSDEIWEDIKDLVIKTIISSESFVTPSIKAFVRNHASCYELFGFDIMLDRNLKPWILEVNISPSLHSNARLDINIKGRMIRDLFNMAAFRLPTKDQLSGEYMKAMAHCLTAQERIKHSQFLQKPLPESERKKILDSLSPDDLRVLMETEDEFSRCGAFERVFPSLNSHKYHKFFEMERYYNILLEEWLLKYHRSPTKGIQLLQKLAKQAQL